MKRMRTAGDVLARLPEFPADRIRLEPPPGTATADDAIAVGEREGYRCELIDGTLIEKPPGFYASWLAIILGARIFQYLDGNDLGIVTGGTGPIWVAEGQMRVPDLAFFAWSKFPGRLLPRQPVLDHVPDLEVAIIRCGNTRGERGRKRREYFASGTTLVWEIEPDDRSARAYTAVDRFTELKDGDRLTGDPVLPGLSVGLTELFERAGRRADD